ncbi:MAG TPA: hypothetical protein PKY77_22580 [Phycisphaerae bacterium]|nr:hypothetical protein [Phycisphaerae bacterium]HRY70882.1 hypothetical protein [Phycisphaerae bacterium]HSA29118.1 hypothetical protein [Phycisphaerae bacterium]
MQPDLKSFCVNGHYLIGASLDMHVIILDPDGLSVVNDVNFEADCIDCYSLSWDGMFLAAAFGFERFCSVEVVKLAPNVAVLSDFRNAATVHRLDRVHVLDVGISPNGETLVYCHATKPAGCAVHLPSGERLKLPNTIAPTNGAWLTDGAVLPFLRKKGGIRVSYRPLTLRTVELPSDARIWRMTAHVGADTVFMVDAKQRVFSLCANTLESIWQTRVSEAGGWITCSGDARFIAVQESDDRERFKGILILDSRSGKPIRRLRECDLASYPLDGPRFLCRSGRFLNAETEKFEEGVSAPKFWSTILAQKPGPR